MRLKKRKQLEVPKTYRLLNRDGSFNFERKKTSLLFTNDLYHSLLSVSWIRFLGYLMGLYLLINLFFAVCYWFLGPQAIEGFTSNNGLERFEECFFFSVQTLATIGYGKLTPHSASANILVTVQALVGMFAVAVQTGIVFARFSRPTAKVVFSQHALIQIIDGVECLVFRVANARMNQIAEATAHVVLLKNEKTKEGDTYRNFYDLKLERNHSPVFALSWTIVHVIDNDSPLKHFTLTELAEADSEIFVSVAGIDETFAQPVHSRMSYVPYDILQNHKFLDIIKRTPSGKITLDISKIHGVEQLP